VKEPIWIRRQEILAAHRMVLIQHGGLDGIRDNDMFESTLIKPQQVFAYSDAGLHKLAASYAMGIVKNHPFVDGNKRTGFMCAVAFLEINGYRFEATEVDSVLQTLALAAGELDEAGFTAWLKTNSRKA